MQKITVLAAGARGARFSNDLVAGLRTGAADAPGSVTLVANTAADAWLHGLKVSPDLDLLMHTLGGSPAATSTVAAGLAAYGVEPAWFAPADHEVATQLVRTQMLEAGYPLSQVTEALCRRWLTPLYADRVRLLPVTDDRVETHVAVADAASPSGQRALHLQEYRARHEGEPVEAVAVVGIDSASPAPGVLDAITGADEVVVVPGDAFGVAGLLDVPGVTAALAGVRVVGVGTPDELAAIEARGITLAATRPTTP
ncbi:2-phospho-L-lactate transferase [Nocardioides phosphati]|uniref:2-phospho-L-lactate transferase n=1 Tax=Nocardioides phosphati TaxID=1867775 RepID=A0ABQ2N7A4_9ACTN|nr:2-phospho-L-lactate transferase CofD family protein [Nocardioides phosphati]GGO84688.1 2-phospho-L-lactate transferase [Nocardioides phosphati]